MGAFFHNGERVTRSKRIRELGCLGRVWSGHNWVSLFLFVTCVVYSTVAAAAGDNMRRLDVSQTMYGELVLPFAEVLEDPSRQLTIDEVLRRYPSDWLPMTIERAVYPPTSSEFWVRIRLENLGSEPAEVIFQHPMSFLNLLMMFDQQGHILSWSGAAQTISTRDVEDTRLAVRTRVPAGTVGMVYLKISQAYKEPLSTSFRAWSPGPHRLEVMQTLSRDTALVGGLLTAAAILFVIAIGMNRLRLYLFVGYMLSAALTLGYFSGVLRWFLPSRLPWALEPGFHIGLFLTIGFLTAFSARHLGLNAINKALFWFYHVLIGCCVLLVMAALLGANKTFIFYATIVSTQLLLLLVVVSWWVFYRHRRELYVFLHALGLTVLVFALHQQVRLLVIGHPMALESYHTGLILIYIVLFVDLMLLILSIAFWLRHQRRHHLIAESQAQQDPLTGLLNRRGFNRRVQDVFADVGTGSLWVATLDLDHFKRVNDTYGHATGDAVLLNMSDALRKSCRSDQVVARFGGEEFVVVFTAEALSGAMSFMERLRTRLSDTVTTVQSDRIHVTTSIGLALVCPMTAEGLEEALEKADVALYHAKSKGRDQVVLYHKHMEKNKPIAVQPVSRLDVMGPEVPGLAK